MAKIYDRVKVTSSTIGTVEFALGAPVEGYRAFSDVVANNDQVYYVATFGAEWEIGIGTYIKSTNRLMRTTIHASSNGNNTVNFSAGIKVIFIAATASAINEVINAASTPTSGLDGNGLVIDSDGKLNVGTASTSRIVVNADNVDLAKVQNNGDGLFVKIARDEYGRVTGTTPVTTDDIHTTLGYDIFSQGQKSPPPTEFPAKSVRGFDAYSSTDFPGNYYSGITITGPDKIKSIQLAFNWNSEELAPYGSYFRVNDDTSNTSEWSEWSLIGASAVSALQVQSDWAVTDTSSKAFIKNKPEVVHTLVDYAKTTDYNIQSSEYNNLFTNRGATGAVTFTLPSASSCVGKTFNIFKVNTYAVILRANSDDTIMDSALGGTIANSTSETTSNLAITAVKVGSTTHKWFITGGFGTWTTA